MLYRVMYFDLLFKISKTYLVNSEANLLWFPGKQDTVLAAVVDEHLANSEMSPFLFCNNHTI